MMHMCVCWQPRVPALHQLLVLFAALLAFPNAGGADSQPTARRAPGGWPGGCPCSDATLCQPIRTPRPARDVLAASGDPFGDPANFDWDAVTIVADVSVDVRDPGLYCQAHAVGRRV
jgi:hypothetical protein